MGVGKSLPDGRRGEDVREGDQPPPRMDDGPAPCFSGGDSVGLGPLSSSEIFANPPSPTVATGVGKRLLDGRRGEDVREICGKSVRHFLTGGSGTGFEKEWILLKIIFF